MRYIGLFLALALAAAAFGQEQTSSVFEVASLKQEANYGGAIGCGQIDPGLYQCSWATLKMMLANAYSVRGFQINGPSWLDGEHYRLTARIRKGAAQAEVLTALQSLLRERFNIVLHTVTEPRPICDLTVAKGGPKLKEVGLPSGGIASTTEKDGSLRVRGQMTIDRLVYMLSANLGRPVIDTTGLKGTYEIDLAFGPDGLDPTAAQMSFGYGVKGGDQSSSPMATDAGNSPPTIFQAVKTLGLELIAGNSPVEMLVVDRANKVPTEN